jgi:hypothetical protein
MELPEDPSYIKVGIRVDTLDALDAKQQLLPTTTPIAEVYQTLRNNLNKASFSQHEALDLIVQQRNCDLEEAEKIFQIFVDKGLLFKDSYGLWRWNK